AQSQKFDRVSLPKIPSIARRSSSLIFSIWETSITGAERILARFALLSASLGVTLALALPATPAQAQGQNFHSYVSGNGSDFNPCTLAQPCQSLSFAVMQTASGGEISCLDSGSSTAGFFGTITQSVTIDCTGVAFWSGLLAINGTGITVTLRNLRINGFAGTGTGISFENGAALFVENCVIENFPTAIDPTVGPGIGIQFSPPDGVTAKLHVTESIIKNNGR